FPDRRAEGVSPRRTALDTGSPPGADAPGSPEPTGFTTMDLGLRDKVIVVTGGAKGIGEGIARVLAAEGAIPVIIGRNAADNEAVVRAIESGGGRALAVRAELTHTEGCRHAVEMAVAQFGRIDGLVNNAGVND